MAHGKRNTDERSGSSRFFGALANRTSLAAGRASSFIFAVSVVIVWAVSGPLFGFSDTWQLVINTGTTVVTFLMVFLIQNTQNRDGAAMQIKLDELIRAVHGARNTVLNLEEMTEEELEQLKAHYLSLAEQARARLQGGGGKKKSGPGAPHDPDQAEIGKTPGSGKAPTKASTA
jgi:low affinity Fe/Cu permease